MQHSLLTLVFDAFLIGSAVCIIAAMVSEGRDRRRATIGGALRRRRIPSRVVTSRSWRPVMYHAHTERRRAA